MFLSFDLGSLSLEYFHLSTVMKYLTHQENIGAHIASCAWLKALRSG